jgi:predicted transcriptional regulator of viral defense system
MPREAFTTVNEIAADQFGYFTASQAQAAGVSSMALVMMEKRGSIERVSRGVYRLPHFPHGPLGEYIEAAFWPAGVTGIISHESALAMYGVSDVNPAHVHITVPKRYRVRRQVPSRYRLHHADLDDHEQTFFEGIPVTTIARTVRDCRESHVGDEIIEQAIADAARAGLLSRRDADQLRAEFNFPRS